MPRLVFSFLVCASLACQSITNLRTPTLEPVCCPPPTEEATACCLPQATIPPEVLIPGQTRTDPLSRSGEHALPNWRVEILEVVRGAEAWALMQEANQFNDAPYEGAEYLLVKLRVTSTHVDAEEHEIYPTDFQVTGDERLSYFSSGQVPPEPALDYKVRSGETVEGWASYFIKQDEGNLLLMFSHIDESDPANIRFIEIDEGARVETDAALTAITPNNLGKEKSEPARVGQTLITKDWEVTAVEFLRGDEVQARLGEPEVYSPTPEPEIEFVLVKVRVRYLGQEPSNRMDGGSFKTLSGGEELDTPYVSGINPPFEARFFPGGESTGWVAVRARTNQPITLMFEPWFDFGDENRRYIELE
ncbi:MAG: hypothetical protein JNL09_09895 [Anaerolineales bacterium]|nr:hypothetical protein [Anaerolineales bacterium]